MEVDDEGHPAFFQKVVRKELEGQFLALGCFQLIDWLAAKF